MITSGVRRHFDGQKDGRESRGMVARSDCWRHHLGREDYLMWVKIGFVRHFFRVRGLISLAYHFGQKDRFVIVQHVFVTYLPTVLTNHPHWLYSITTYCPCSCTTFVSQPSHYLYDLSLTKGVNSFTPIKLLTGKQLYIDTSSYNSCTMRANTSRRQHFPSTPVQSSGLAFPNLCRCRLCSARKLVAALFGSVCCSSPLPRTLRCQVQHGGINQQHTRYHVLRTCHRHRRLRLHRGPHGRQTPRSRPEVPSARCYSQRAQPGPRCDIPFMRHLVLRRGTRRL